MPLFVIANNKRRRYKGVYYRIDDIFKYTTVPYKKLKNNNGEFLLQVAARSGSNLFALRLIEEYKKKTNNVSFLNLKGTNGKTALHEAIIKGNERFTQLLLCCGADKKVRDDQGKMPLWYARRYNKKDLITLLEYEDKPYDVLDASFINIFKGNLPENTEMYEIDENLWNSFGENSQYYTPVYKRSQYYSTKEKRWVYLSEKKKMGNVTRFKDIVGMDYVKHQIKNTVEFFKDPKKAKKKGIDRPKGILLSGPPGTGKTMLARAVAAECGCNFISVSGTQSLSKWYGESMKKIRDLFNRAQKQRPCIIFIDEFDSIARDRDLNGHSEDIKVVNELLTQMDGFDSDTGVLVMAATNNVDRLDSAITRRFSETISIFLPSEYDRKKMLTAFLNEKDAALYSQASIRKLAKVTRFFAPAHLKKLVNIAMKYAIDSGREVMTTNDLEMAYKAVRQEVDKYGNPPYGTMTFLHPKLGSDGSFNPDNLQLEQWVLPLPQLKLVKEIVTLLSDPQKLLSLSKDEEFSRKYIAPKNILLHGPPGTGKTHLAKQIAEKALCNFYTIDTSTVEAAKALKAIFDMARQKAPCIIFFDELDGIAGFDRNHNISEKKRGLISTFLSELDGFKKESKNGTVVVIGTTNHPQLLDRAFSERFKMVHVGFPTFNRRVKLLGKFIGDLTKVDEGVNTLGFVKILARLTQNYSIRRLAQFVGKTVLQGNFHKKNELTKDDFIKTLKLMPSNTRQ